MAGLPLVTTEGWDAMSNVIYPMSLVTRYRRKADETRRHAALMRQTDLR
jgi:hypothetical protein